MSSPPLDGPEEAVDATRRDLPRFDDDDGTHPAPGPAPLPMDTVLFSAFVLLLGFGVVMVGSAGAWLGHSLHGRWDYHLSRQLIFATIGLALMLGVSRLDYRVLRRLGPWLVLVAVVSLVAVLVGGHEVNGARRWLRAGPINVQPSEFAKLALLIYLAGTLARQGERVRRFRAGFLPPVLVAAGVMILVLAENDLGTTILLGSVTLAMLFVAGTRIAYVAAAMMIAAPVVWTQVVGVEYRRGRLEDFLTGDGYQVQQALISIGSGGPFGLGLGDGRQKLGFLPENHTDFILATIGEELGYAGLLGTIVVFAIILVRGVVIAGRVSDRFGAYLGLGVATLFGLQAFINMAVVLQVVPAKGITLPFLSYGGASLLVSSVAAGLLLSLSRRPPPSAWSDQRKRRAGYGALQQRLATWTGLGRRLFGAGPADDAAVRGVRPNRRAVADRAAAGAGRGVG